MTVDSELNKSEIYRAMVNKRDSWNAPVPSLLIARDIENLETERLKSITFFDKSKFTPVVLEDINTVRKIFNYNFNDQYYLFDFFEGIDIDDVDICKIDSLCREMRAEIKIQEMKRESNELETGREVTRANRIDTDENTLNVRGTWFVG